MASLYELTQEWLQLQDMLEDPDIPDDAIQDTLEALEGAIEWKADGYAKVIRNMEASITAIKAEKDWLTKKQNRLEASIGRLKERLQEAMITTGKRKIKTDLFTFAIQKNGGKLPVVLDVDVADLPDDFVIITEKADLKAIGEYLETHPDCVMAHFGERGESLRIR